MNRRNNKETMVQRVCVFVFLECVRMKLPEIFISYSSAKYISESNRQHCTCSHRHWEINFDQPLTHTHTVTDTHAHHNMAQYDNVNVLNFNVFFYRSLQVWRHVKNLIVHMSIVLTAANAKTKNKRNEKKEKAMHKCDDDVTNSIEPAS